MLKKILLYPINRLMGLAAFPAQILPELKVPRFNHQQQYPTISWESQLSDTDPILNRKVYFTTYGSDKAYAEMESERKYIIHAVGNGMRVQDYHEQYIQEAARWPQATIIAFNYPGVSESPGVITQCQDAIDNGIMMVKWVEQNQKAKRENIALVGHSIGGAVLAHVAQAMPGVTLFADRTFAKLSLVAHNLLWWPALQLSILGCNLLIACALGWMAGLAGLIISAAVVCKVGTAWFRDKVFLPLFPALLKYTIGDLEVTAAFRDIPGEKRYAINAYDDEIIHREVNLLSDLNAQDGEYNPTEQCFSLGHTGGSSLIFTGTESKQQATGPHMTDREHLYTTGQFVSSAERRYEAKIQAFLGLRPAMRPN